MTICYINFNLDNPRDQVTLRGLRENGISVIEIADSQPGWRKYVRIARAYRAKAKSCDYVIVGFAASILVVLLRLLTSKKLFYNALSTLYDSMIISRSGGRIWSLSSLWYYVIDYIAFHSADHSFIECNAQKNLAIKIFHVAPQRMSVNLVGVDDTQFYLDPAIRKVQPFTVVFRGMFLPEAGTDVVIRAAKELEDTGILFKIIGRGLLQKEVKNLLRQLNPTNVELITEKLPIEILRRNMLECHLSLGQLADHSRVHTTIPHKAFESMAMGLPYLTGDNGGVREILEDGKTCFTVAPGDYRALARRIVELRDHAEDLARVAENARQLYLQNYTPKCLAKKMIATIHATL